MIEATEKEFTSKKIIPSLLFLVIPGITIYQTYEVVGFGSVALAYFVSIVAAFPYLGICCVVDVVLFGGGRDD